MPPAKPQGTVSLEEIKKNIVELHYRVQTFVNPEYEVHELFDPNSVAMRNLRLNRIEWWEEWQRQERFLSFAQRNPFKRLGEIRASTDDHCFNQISKVLEDLTVQIDLLSQFLALQARAGPIERATPKEQAYDLPAFPAEPISKATLERVPDDEEEDEGDDADAAGDGGSQLEEVEDDEDF